MLAGCQESGIVFDPFIGSGTVGFVALLSNRNYIGIELNGEYVELAKERIESEVKGFGKEKKQNEG